MEADEWDSYTQQPIKTEAEGLAEWLEHLDVVLACNYCGEWWDGDNFTPLMQDFHGDLCPLRGRLDVLEAFGVNVDYLKACGDDHRLPPGDPRRQATNPAAAG